MYIIANLIFYKILKSLDIGDMIYWKFISINCKLNLLQLRNMYSKTCLKQPLKKRQNKDFSEKW